MSEINLNEEVSVIVEDATVITIPIDDTLTISGDAADAKAVGDALALKADASQVMGISVNGQTADNQGAIIVDGTEISMSPTDSTTLNEAIEAAANRTGETIPINETQGAATIDSVLTDLVQDVETLTGDTVRISGQTLTEEQKTQIQDNIGAASASDVTTLKERFTSSKLNIANGGTGASTAAEALTALGAQSALVNQNTSVSGKGITLYLYKYGKVVYFELPVNQTSSAVTAGTAIVNVPEGWRPRASCYAVGANGGWDYAHQVMYELTTSGNLLCKADIANGSSIAVAGCYLCP